MQRSNLLLMNFFVTLNLLIYLLSHSSKAEEISYKKNILHSDTKVIKKLEATTDNPDEQKYIFAGPFDSSGNSGSDQLPEIPAIYRNVSGIISAEFSRPHLPVARMSRDGRIAIIATKAYAVKPTAVKASIVDQPRGAIADFVDFEQGKPLPYKVVETSICEPAEGHPVSGRKNPYTCGSGGNDDCYDLHIVTQRPRSASEPNLISFHSVPMTFQVENPKTKDARIVKITRGDSTVRDSYLTHVTVEPMTPADGRLLVTRSELQTLTWFNENTGQFVKGKNVDIVYSYIEEPHQPCDASQWKEFKPLSHAPYDERLNKRYKFAAFPFRDASGRVIPDGDDMQGSYPWLDKDAINVTMMMGTERLHELDVNGKVISQRYPARCVVPGCTERQLADFEDRFNYTGMALFGGWTQGKVVLLDGILNESDYKIGIDDSNHNYVSLYRPASGLYGNESGEVHVGGVREVPSFPAETFGFKPVHSGRPDGYFFATFFDSIENRFNFWQPLRPVTPKDVSWLSSTGRHTDELAFDDYLNPHAFIVSNMVGLMDRVDIDPRSARFTADYKDGWSVGELAFTQEVRLQNSATTLPEYWHVPVSGELHNGRLEPVALGGVRGRGVWFNGTDTYISYKIKEQPRRVDAFHWYVGVFLDPRTKVQHSEQALIEFPDGSVISIFDQQEIRYREPQGNVKHKFALPRPLESTQWSHIGMSIGPGGYRIQLLLNGLLYDDYVSDTPLFQMVPGKLRVGYAKNGLDENEAVGSFHGWVDEFKVFARRFTPEVACNHAHGTLIGLPANYSGPWKATAADYPASTHRVMDGEMRMRGEETYPSYACYLDNSWDYAAHMMNLPEGTIGLREAVNFPEGPVYYDQPRPDSVFNSFCLDCHHKQAPIGLSLNALRFDPNLLAQDDPRRQPMQPPALIRGNLPEGWLNNGYHRQLEQQGIPIDSFILPSAKNTISSISGFTLVDADTGYDIMPLVDGMTIDRSLLPTPRVNIRALTSSLTRLVEFDFDGEQFTADSAPFAIFGTEDDNYLGQPLPTGFHVLSAKVADSLTEFDDKLNEISFTVIGELANPETGVDPVYVELPEAENVVETFALRLSDVFESFIPTITDTLLDRFVTSAKAWIEELIERFIDFLEFENRDESGLSISIRQAVKYDDEIFISGVVTGPHTGNMMINGESAQLENGRFDFKTARHKIDTGSVSDEAQQIQPSLAYDLEVESANGGSYQTTILFENQVIKKGAAFRLDNESELFTRLADSIAGKAIPQVVSGLNNLQLVNVDTQIFELRADISSISANSGDVVLATGALSKESINLRAEAKINDLILNGQITQRFCIPWFWGNPPCWQSTSVLRMETVMHSPINIQIIEGRKNREIVEIKSVSGSVYFSDSTLSVLGLPEWMLSPLAGVIEWLIREPAQGLVGGLVTAQAEQAVEEQISPILAKVTSSQESIAGYPSHETEVNALFGPLLLVSQYTPKGVSLSFEPERLETTGSSLIAEFNPRLLSSTYDQQVLFGYRADVSKGASESAPAVIDNLETVNNRDALVYIKGQQVNQFLSGLTQEGLIDHRYQAQISDILRIENLMDTFIEQEKTSSQSSGSMAGIEDQSEAVNQVSEILHEHILKMQTEINGLGQPVVIDAEVISSPYLLMPEGDEVMRIAFDNVLITLGLDQGELKGDKELFSVSVDMQAAIDLKYAGEQELPTLSISDLTYNVIEQTNYSSDIPPIVVDKVSQKLLSKVPEELINNIKDELRLPTKLLMSQSDDLRGINGNWFRPTPESTDVAIAFDFIFD
ncbi:hypothetical protein [Veronia pacifica]|uniref:LamG-like jellyroll fold domain-containing protein n=1 Tax=Veronia pacifica TaxID=1080227 RepID=A0A1C3EMM9_9GAMM|nr:hypothetical protein [Veronia pacifica]ODA34497.1 hypothetical protein A8L45_05870 [Veronia pacifica]